MERDKFIDKITKEKRFLIDYENLKNNLFLYQSKLFKNKKEIENFLKYPYKGLPILIPNKLFYFKYNTDDNYNYKLHKKFIKEKFYRIKNKKNNYEPCDMLTSFGLEYSSGVIAIKGFANKKIFQNINNFNNISKLKISNIIKKYKKVCSFQTRNIPHLGHEKILDRLLENFDHVVVNPVLGPKKKGDVKYKVLSEAFNFLIKNKYTNKKLSFIPIIANMFYAGPFEALHHANIRSSLGFKFFVVGRDHAGAGNMYKPDAAFRIVNSYKKKIKIKTIALKGSYFCKKCNRIIIKDDCHHKKLENISGTDFRCYLLKKKIFRFADRNMQVHLKKFKNLFVK